MPTDAGDATEGGRTVTFDVPPDLREYAPDEAAALTVDARTLALAPADPESTPKTPEFSTLDDGFPRGRAGVAMALLVDKLDSLALNRPAIEALLGEVEAAGGDPYLTLERLARRAAEGEIDPPFAVERRRRQLEGL